MSQPSPLGRLVVSVLALGGSVLGLGACAFDSSGSAGLPAAAPAATSTPSVTTPAEATPAPTAQTSKPPKTKARPAENDSAISDAQYFVGTEITPGTWRSRSSDTACFADTQTRAGRVLEQADVAAGETSTIRIKRSAYTFTSRGCGTWKRVS